MLGIQTCWENGKKEGDVEKGVEVLPKELSAGGGLEKEALLHFQLE